MKEIDKYEIDRDIYEVAKSLNCKVRLPSKTTIQIDIDSEEGFSLFKDRIGLVQRYIYLGDYRVWTSKSGFPKRHIEIDVGSHVPLGNPLRILLQVILGSDINREVLNTIRYLKFGDSKSCFFEPLTGGGSENESSGTEG